MNFCIAATVLRQARLVFRQSVPSDLGLLDSGLLPRRVYGWSSKIMALHTIHTCFAQPFGRDWRFNLFCFLMHSKMLSNRDQSLYQHLVIGIAFDAAHKFSVDFEDIKTKIP